MTRWARLAELARAATPGQWGTHPGDVLRDQEEGAPVTKPRTAAGRALLERETLNGLTAGFEGRRIARAGGEQGDSNPSGSRIASHTGTPRRSPLVKPKGPTRSPWQVLGRPFAFIPSWHSPSESGSRRGTPGRRSRATRRIRVRPTEADD